MDLAEQGKIGTIIVKDHSRLGRNRLVVGQLLEEDFERLDVRYIAIMDNIDTAKGISDLVPMQDLFNEWHVKTRARKCGMSCAIRECRARRLQPSRHLDTKKSRQSKRMAR